MGRVRDPKGGAVSSSTNSQKPAVVLSGTVDKIIPENFLSPEKAQISVDGADGLYREIRVENSLQDENGNEVALKRGAHVEVTIAADSAATEPKNE
jgi:hypothetical protein